MSDQLETIEHTLAPKSDQLNADDLITGPITVQVEKVTGTPGEDDRIDVHITGHKPFRPCKTMRRVLAIAWTEQARTWLGKSMKLYRDPDVIYAGQKEGGIRIEALSDIDKPITMMLTIRKGKRAPYTVQPLKETPTEYPAADFEKNMPAWVDAVAKNDLTIPRILQRVKAKGILTNAQRETLENAVEQRKKEFE